MIEQCWLFHCGYSKVPEPAVFEDGKATVFKQLPFLCLLLVHETLGPILLDAPFGHEGPSNAGALLGQVLRRFGMSFEPSWAVTARVEQLGFKASQVEHVMMTHLHFDHTGGMKALGHAKFHISEPGWSYATTLGKFDAMRQGYAMADYRALGDNVQTFDIARYFDREASGTDVLGDGSIEAFGLPGHAPGHTGYRFKLTDGRQVFFLGDAIFNLEHLRGRGLGMMPKMFASHTKDAFFTAEELVRYAHTNTEDIFICSHDFSLGERCIAGPVAIHAG